MSEIFYSELDQNLQAELNARAGAAARRTKDDLDFMIGKIANVTITPYTTPEKKQTIVEAIYGGSRVRGNEYLPDGFLKDNLRRTPPYISSAEIAIGDHSMGLLNTATVNLIIPNPADIEFVEAIYFHPGRCVEVTFEHPESACVLNTSLTDTTLESYNKCAELFKNLSPQAFDETYRSINKVTFEGLITSFNFNYQSDMSVAATITMRGTSNVYTDVSLIVNQQAKQPEKAEKPATSPTKPEGDAEVDTFYSNLKNLLDQAAITQLKFQKPPIGAKAPPRKGVVEWRNPDNSNTKQSKYLFGIVGTPSKSLRSEQQYITLAWLVQYINDYCLDKLRKPDNASTMPGAYIVFNEDTCKSTYYDPKYFKSTNPERIFFTDVQNRTYEHKDTKKNLIWYGPIDDIKNDTDINTCQSCCKCSLGKLPPFLVGSHYTPAAIMINLNVIKEITDKLKEEKSFTVGEFLKRVSSEVYAASGHAIELALTTHPEDTRFLIWYDSKFIIKPGPQPYYVPMTADDKHGQIVRDFEFSGKLPDDASHLAYALNQDISSLSESDIAPFVSYLYAQASNPTYQDANVIAALEKYKTGGGALGASTAYGKSHTDAVTKLEETIQTFAAEATEVNAAALTDALQKYIQFPTNSLEQTNNVAAPVIPFDTSFTIDGINGFKYGDVLMFRILPSRYVNNTVFSVINVTHTVATDGQWTTTVRSIMRPKFD